MAERHHVVIIGSGFGGLWATRRLKGADVDVTVIDRTSHHLFQPLLYQVATGILSEGEIAPPTRDILRHQSNTRVLLGEVKTIDLAARTVTHEMLDKTTVTPYDFLVVAAGPTGVEMAGQIAELSRRTLKGNFRNIDPSTTRVVLLDAADKVLGTFGDSLSTHAREELEDMGVEVQLGAMVVDVDEHGIEVKEVGASPAGGTAGSRRIEAR